MVGSRRRRDFLYRLGGILKSVLGCISAYPCHLFPWKFAGLGRRFCRFCWICCSGFGLLSRASENPGIVFCSSFAPLAAPKPYPNPNLHIREKLIHGYAAACLESGRIRASLSWLYLDGAHAGLQTKQACEVHRKSQILLREGHTWLISVEYTL